MNRHINQDSAQTTRQTGNPSSGPVDHTSSPFTRRTKVRFVGKLTNERTAPLEYNSFETVRNEHLMVQNEHAAFLASGPIAIGPGFLTQDGKTQRFDTTGGGWVEVDKLLADKYSPVVEERIFRDYGRPDPAEGWKYLYEFSVFSERLIKLGDGEMQQRIIKAVGYPFDGITPKGELRWQEPEEMESAF